MASFLLGRHGFGQELLVVIPTGPQMKSMGCKPLPQNHRAKKLLLFHFRYIAYIALYAKIQFLWHWLIQSLI